MILFAVMGCASVYHEVSVKSLMPQNNNDLPSFLDDPSILLGIKTISVEVDSRVDGSQEETLLLKKMIEGELDKNLKPWKKIAEIEMVDNNNNGDIQVRATILDIKKVSAGKRFLAGRLYGRASIELLIELKIKNKTIDKFIINSKAPEGSIFGIGALYIEISTGYTELAIKESATQVANVLFKGKIDTSWSLKEANDELAKIKEKK